MKLKRKRYSGIRNSRQFSRVARKVHKKNVRRKLSRGGIRL